MFRRITALILTLPLFGCGSNPEGASQGYSVQTRIGDSDVPATYLPFNISAVYHNQKPADVAPFHVDGGDWLFLDCEADNQTKFLVGTITKKLDGGESSQWGRAILAVNDNESGGRFVEQFSKAFGGTLPTPTSTPQAPKPLFINTAVLAENYHRDTGGGFSGDGGGWTASKWFLSNDLAEAEVYFNFNVVLGQGEFSEKDEEYADDLLGIFAAALRDGPRPQRTPENDPNLTIDGPAIGAAHKLTSRRTSLATFTPDGRFAVFQDNTKIFALTLELPDGMPVGIAEFEYSPWHVQIANNDIDLLVTEGVQQQKGVQSSDDPVRIWWVDHTTREQKLLRGPEKGIRLGEAAISPDYKFVALEQYIEDKSNRTQAKVVHILDRYSEATITVKLPKKDLSFVGWKETTAGLRAVGMTNRWGFEKDQPSETYLIDPSTGELQQPQPDTSPELLSPDGKFRVQSGDGFISVSNVENGQERQFIFHEDDRPFVGDTCVEWVSPDYLVFHGPRLALINVQSMKMSFPQSADGTHFASRAYTFSPDLRWALFQGETNDGEGLFIAPIELPKE